MVGLKEHASLKGRIIRRSLREFHVRDERGELLTTKAKGNLLKRGEGVVVGDNVRLERIVETGQWLIIAVEPRRSEIFRISLREQRKRITAANCDLLVILSSVSRPSYKQGIVDRFLVRACQWGIRPIVVFNKMDEFDSSLELDLPFEQERLRRLGVECYEVSAKKGEDYRPQFLALGWQELRQRLQKRTAIFLGQSGVGKSKMISQLSGGQFELKTKSIGKVGKGTHTTTWSELIELPHFFLMDSPGIRSFSLEDIDPRDLLSYFPDLEEIAVGCKFRDCQHEEDSKGCAFHQRELGEELGEFQLQALQNRLKSYKKIYKEIVKIPIWSKKIN